MTNLLFAGFLFGTTVLSIISANMDNTNLYNPNLRVKRRTDRKHHDTLRIKSNFAAGQWGPDEFCPVDQYVIGLQLISQISQESHGRKKREFTNILKMSKSIHAIVDRRGHPVVVNGYFGHDDFGLLGIILICAAHWTLTNSTESISSNYIRFSDSFMRSTVQTTDPIYCHESFATGFEVKQQGSQGTHDDNGITNFKLIWADKQEVGQTLNHEPGGWHIQDKKKCDMGNAICGIRTKVEVDHHDDNTGLNDVMIYCCPSPKLQDESEVCDPQKNMMLAATYINKGFSPTIYKYKVKLGVTREKGSKTTNRQSHTSNTETGFGIELETSGGVSEFQKTTLTTRFEQKFGTSSTSESERETSSSETLTEEVEQEQEVVVEPGMIFKLYQEVKTCGSFTSFSRKLERRDEHLPAALLTNISSMKNSSSKISLGIHLYLQMIFCSLYLYICSV